MKHKMSIIIYPLFLISYPFLVIYHSNSSSFQNFLQTFHVNLGGLVFIPIVCVSCTVSAYLVVSF